MADKKKFIIAAAEGTYSFVGMNSWNADLDPAGVNDVEFVKDLIKEISSKLTIDPKRIYATGFSGGARMCSRLACELSNVIVAIGPVAGLQFPDNCAPTRSVSVIAFHGTADRVNHYAHQVDSPPAWKKGVEDSVSDWVKKNDCKNASMTSKISEDVNQITYGGCKDNAEVVFYRINGGGHT